MTCGLGILAPNVNLDNLNVVEKNADSNSTQLSVVLPSALKCKYMAYYMDTKYYVARSRYDICARLTGS